MKGSCKGGSPPARRIGKGCSCHKELVQLPWFPCPHDQYGKAKMEPSKVRLTSCRTGTELDALVPSLHFSLFWAADSASSDYQS